MSQTLPIDAIKADFIQALSEHQTLILSAEPGAGKSTRLPLWLLDSALGIKGKIYLLQPRRVAVKNVATFLAQQISEPVGHSIGYRLRNESKVSATTRLEVVTEGILVQIMQQDPEMLGTSLIIIDEFHERSLQADLAFALARDIQQGLRDDLTLLLMSATLASDILQKALPDAFFLSSQGRNFPVSVDYQPIKNIRLWREQTLAVIKQALLTTTGSILVFLPSSGDIRYLNEQLINHVSDNFIIYPLYGDLSLAEQQQAIFPSASNQQKVVLATNIAETSLTIEGISLVIDTGLEKVAIYDEQTLTNKLLQRNIAKSSAIQRMGRAGRLAAGHCIRLFSKEEFNRRSLQNTLPIQQADILPVVIEAARWGVSTLAELPLLDFPGELAEKNAWQTLKSIAVIDQQKRLTTHGEQVAKLACHARFAHMIISAKALEQKYQCLGLTYLACLLSALLEERDIYNGEQAKDDCDIRPRVLSLLSKKNHSKYRQTLLQANKLAQHVKTQKFTDIPVEFIGVLLFLAYPERLAKSRKSYGEYIASYGKGLMVNEQDALAKEPLIVAAHLSQYQQKLIVRLAASVELEQLMNWQLVTIKEQKKLQYDQDSGRIIAVIQNTIGAIILEEKTTKSLLKSEDVFRIWQQQIIKQGLSFLSWRTGDLALLQRWRWINKNQSQLNFPDVSEAALLDGLEDWLQPFVGDIINKNQLAKLHLTEPLMALLDYQQQQILNNIAPSYFIGPTGRKCVIRYSEQQPPIVSLPMQEVYGLQASPTVGDGLAKINLTVELLSPAQRPIQITADLAGFWQGSYKEVQKEMKAKYPKHYWPDDPANAKATNKTKRHLNI